MVCWRFDRCVIDHEEGGVVVRLSKKLRGVRLLEVLCIDEENVDARRATRRYEE